MISREPKRYVPFWHVQEIRNAKTEKRGTVLLQKTFEWSSDDQKDRRATATAHVILGHAAADATRISAERDADKAREVAKKLAS